MQKIALALGALALVAFADAQPGQARYDGKWCAYESRGKGVISERCDLKTYEACRAWINASSGTWCTENPWYQATQPGRRKKS
jgi:hypothetical protein